MNDTYLCQSYADAGQIFNCTCGKCELTALPKTDSSQKQCRLCGASGTTLGGNSVAGTQYFGPTHDIAKHYAVRDEQTPEPERLCNCGHSFIYHGEYVSESNRGVCSECGCHSYVVAQSGEVNLYVCSECRQMMPLAGADNHMHPAAPQPSAPDELDKEISEAFQRNGFTSAPIGMTTEIKVLFHRQVIAQLEALKPWLTHSYGCERVLGYKDRAEDLPECSCGLAAKLADFTRRAGK